MITDCHTHLNCGQKQVTAAEHLEAAENLDACLVLAAPSQRPDPDPNTVLGEYAKKQKDKIFGFATLNPPAGKINLKRLTQIKQDLDLAGVVLYCAEQAFHPCHTRAMQLYETAEQLAMPVFFHNSAQTSSAVLDYARPFLLDEVARTFPNLRIVIGNMGSPFLRQTIALAAKHPNVYADLTVSPDKVWEVYNIVITAYEQGVMDKLLFGSGYPYGNAGQCIETLLGFNKLLADTNLPTVPRGSIRHIIERNTLELLGIPHPAPAPTRR